MTNPEPIFDLNAYHYHLPEKNIAQEPAARRDESRLLLVDRRRDLFSHYRFRDLVDFFAPGDILVVNDTRVFPARLQGRKETGGRVEFLLLEYPRPPAPSLENGWHEVLVAGLLKSSKRPGPGGRLFFGPRLEGVVDELLPDGKVRVRLRFSGDFGAVIEACGAIPLPPYIRRQDGEAPWDRERYQTVFARRTGAVAAPTAGLHFTDQLLDRIRERRVEVVSVTLHVGYGTFAPVRVADIRHHRIHAEYLEVPVGTARRINAAKSAGGRVWAVGTTTVRALESVAEDGKVRAGSGRCDLYIYPGYRFQVVDNLVTNFHLPRSSLLFMVSALAGRERILRAYEEALRHDYRFYSYGDAMVIRA